MSPLEKLLYVMRRLRDPDTGCPWDLKQTYESIAPHTIEEVYEVVDAIENGSTEELADELGDLLFQVVFYAQLGAEANDFDFDAIVTGVTDKLVRRHPHVFPNGDIHAALDQVSVTADDVVVNWEQIKKDERKEKYLASGQLNDSPPSILDNVPLALPSLARAAKLQKKAASVGFDWDSVGPVLEKLKEEVAELEKAMKTENHDQIREELADVIFSAVNLGRHYRIEPESALRAGNSKFEKRFRYMEKLIEQKGLTVTGLDLNELEQFWQQSKRET